LELIDFVLLQLPLVPARELGEDLVMALVRR
jgi:hypothetical protein